MFLSPACSTAPNVRNAGPASESDGELLQSGTAAELYARANTLFDMGDYLHALRLYEATIDRDSMHLGAIVNCGVCARRLGDVDGAIAWYDRALAIDPRDPAALQNRIVAGLLLGRIEESLRLAMTLTEVIPTDAEAWHQLGNIHMQLSQFEPAVVAYERATRTSAGNAGFVYSLALSLAAANQYERSAQHFANALAMNADLLDIYAPYVQVLLLLERYEDAWNIVAEGQSHGAVFDADLILELQQRSGRVGPGVSNQPALQN